jgi:hypothetical protein
MEILLKNYYFYNGIKIVICLLVTVFTGSGGPFLSSVNAELLKTGGPEPAHDTQQVIGRWVRSDGGYYLEFHYNEKDGKFTAAYYNPRPINVSKTELNHDKDTINIFVELRDVNYPGSTYALEYDTGTDRLTGTYFQAVNEVTYAIEFIRSHQIGK